MTDKELLENYATSEEMFELKDWKRDVQERLGHLNPEYTRAMI